jgi:magnesium transporter
VQTLERIDRARIEELLARDEFFWLDLIGPTEAEIDELAALLGWNPLAVEDVKEFRQRPKLDDYRTHALLVFYGVHAPAADLVEVHVFVSGSWVVTVRRQACRHLDERRESVADDPPETEEEVVYRVLDALTDSFLPVVHDAQERLEDLEDEIVAGPTEEHLGRVLGLRRQLGPMRRVAEDQRDMFVDARAVLDRLPGLETSDDATDAFRDISDHLQKIAELLESMRDQLVGAVQLYSSMTDNRLNRVTERLTLVATVFLPLTFTVGFFGQNFGWLVRHIDGFGPFLIWGIGVGEVLPLVLLYALFRRAGWVRGPVVSPALRKRTDED